MRAAVAANRCFKLTWYRVKNPRKALLRDLNYLVELGAIGFRIESAAQTRALFAVNLDWPMQITETKFFQLAKAMPKGKVRGFLSS